MFILHKIIDHKATILKQEKEVWLRGKNIEGVPPLLQPVAHALLQAGEELTDLMQDFNDQMLWAQPAGCAAPGFHLLHMRGVLDRLLTYAEGRALDDAQLKYLGAETQIQADSSRTLVAGCKEQIETTLERLRQFENDELLHVRTVGRAQLPSTVIGLCTHAAEHTMRHIGQLLVTVKVLQQSQA